MTLQPFTDALLPLALPLLGGTLANVRAQLSFVGRTIAVVGDAVPFIGDPIAPRLFCFTNCERALSAVEVGATPIRFAPGTGLSAIDHNQP